MNSELCYPLRLRGREFTAKDIAVIDRITKKYFTKGRTYISIEVCKKLDWKQPNGWLKDRACREVLRLLDEKKIIGLPTSKTNRLSLKSTKAVIRKETSPDHLAAQNLSKVIFNKIELVQVKGTKSEALWNDLVNQYHYLGFKTFVGRSLKYLIYYEGKILSAIGFCDPSWRLEARDNIFKAKGFTEKQIRWNGINNGRFLILPWIKIPNLASNLLAKAIKIVRSDWEEYYKVKPMYVETFVHSEKFPGTCYKASNWNLIGITKGYKKTGWLHSNSQVPKHIFLYTFRRK